MLDEQTIAFRVYDGNGMYLTAGNPRSCDERGRPALHRLRGRKRHAARTASRRSTDDDPLLAEYPEAQLVVRVHATEVFRTAPRYIHEYKLVTELAVRAEEGSARRRCRSGSTERLGARRLPFRRTDDPASDPSREVIPREVTPASGVSRRELSTRFRGTASARRGRPACSTGCRTRFGLQGWLDDAYAAEAERERRRSTGLSRSSFPAAIATRARGDRVDAAAGSGRDLRC